LRIALLMVGDFVFLSFMYDLTILIGVLTLLDAATNDLAQVITRLDLEGTPMMLSPRTRTCHPESFVARKPDGQVQDTAYEKRLHLRSRCLAGRWHPGPRYVTPPRPP
jgi:hypothetical protein